MKILVTAFGPFGGRTENASSLVLARLKREFPEIHTRTIPVDSVVGPDRLTRAVGQHSPTCLLMLGEATGSREIRLETTAWNELDFRIPDIAGRQPSRRPIHPDTPQALHSTLPFGRIHSLLAAAGHPVALSDDPGRYLCNQILYVALHLLQTRRIPCEAGFVHLPLEDIYPTHRAADAISLILRDRMDDPIN